MKKKIFLYYIILIIIGVSITGFFTSEVAQKFYKFEVEEKLKNTASLIRYEVAEDISTGAKFDYNQVAKKYAEILNQSSQTTPTSKNINSRITFVDFKGNVLGESETNFHEMGNHLNRKEIQQAIQGKTGQDTRFSQTLKIDFLYIAVPINSANVVVRVSVPLMQLNKIYVTIWGYTLLGILTGILLTILLALRFSSSITRPIKELTDASKEISVGNYSKRVNISSKEEIGQLSNTFNYMAAKMENTVSDLLDKNLKVDSIMNSMVDGIVAVDSKYKVVLINAKACDLFGIESKVDAIGVNIMEVIRNNPMNTFLKDTIEKNISLVNEISFSPPENKILRVYTNPIKSADSPNTNLGGIVFIQDITKIKKLEQIRTEFVSNVTHELKTPLTSIRGFIETLRNGAIDDPVVSEKFLEIIDIEAERLSMLINDILQLSEIENRQEDFNINIYRLRPIAEETFSILQSAADKKNITLCLEINESIEITANRNRIKQMLINLVDNGINYNNENGKVTVKAYKAEGMLVITVKDTGIGIDKEHIQRIFERFYRVDKSRSRSMGGTGLGLSIVKHIVHLYNGDVSVKSEPDKGSEFIIQFPA